MKTFKTPKGTDLPLLNLKGKDYLQAQHRVVWFREEKPDWGIETEIVSHSPDHTLCRATIRNEQGRIMAQASKEETKQGFQDHMEKAETGSIARALALVGFGTQFAQEFEEGERLVDSPSPQVVKENAPQGRFRKSGMPFRELVCPFGKLKGKTFAEAGMPALAADRNYWVVRLQSEGRDASGVLKKYLEDINKYLGQ